MGRHYYHHFTYQTAKALLKGKISKKVQNNTYLVHQPGDCIAFRLHSTDLIKFYRNTFIIDCNLWRSFTTRNRLNDGLPEGYGVGSRKGQWILYTPRGQYVYQDGVRINYKTGNMSPKLQPAPEPKWVKTRWAFLPSELKALEHDIIGPRRFHAFDEFVCNTKVRVKASDTTLMECGSCSQYHRNDYHGDCRSDADRYESPEDYAERKGLLLSQFDFLDLEFQEEPVEVIVYRNGFVSNHFADGTLGVTEPIREAVEEEESLSGKNEDGELEECIWKSVRVRCKDLSLISFINDSSPQSRPWRPFGNPKTA